MAAESIVESASYTGFSICIFEKCGGCIYRGDIPASGSKQTDSDRVLCMKESATIPTCDKAKIVPTLRAQEEVQRNLNMR